MSTTVEREPRTIRWILYGALGAVFLFLAVAALVTFHAGRETARAQEKADQFIAALNQAGLRTPSKDQVVRVLGDDGGAVCADPNSALRRSVVHGMLTNGAAGPGIRPVIADNNVLKGQLLVMKTYCPDQLPEFTEFAENLKLDDVAKE